MSHRVTPPKNGLHREPHTPKNWAGGTTWTCPFCNKKGAIYLERLAAVYYYREHIAKAHPMF